MSSLPFWSFHLSTHQQTHTHTHPFNRPLSGTTEVSRYQKVKPTWILLKQETVSGSGISWAICKSAPRSRQKTTPVPNHSVFYRPDALPVAQPTVSKNWRQLNSSTEQNANSLHKFSSVNIVLTLIFQALTFLIPGINTDPEDISSPCPN